jgi:thioredoxin reductase (NADPH)
VVHVSGGPGAFTIGTDRGDTIEAKAIVIAAGAGAFGPNRPPLDGLAAFEASGAVQYYVRRREAFRGKRVVIAGGGDSAVDWALALKDVAAHVAVIHRRPKFRAAPETAAQLDAAAARGEVELVVPYQLHALHGTEGRLEAVEVATLAGERRTLVGDVLLAFFGLAMDLGPIAAWGLDLERHHVIVAPATCETSEPGIFAIGDVCTYPGKLKLILQGFSEAAMAAHAIHPIARPGQALHFEYSTTTGVPAG